MPFLLTTPLIQNPARAFRHAHRSSFLSPPNARPRGPNPIPLDVMTVAYELVTHSFTAYALNFILQHSILFFVEEVFGVGGRRGEGGRRGRMRLEDHPIVSRLLRLVVVKVVRWAIDSNAGFLFVMLCAWGVCYLAGRREN